MPAESYTNFPLYYLGPAGEGFGFQLAGITVVPCASAAELVKQLTKLAADSPRSILFVDEGLAAQVLDEVERLNDAVLPVILLVPGAAVSRQVSAQNMARLMTRAVGSDIFSS
ncbi:MAG: hypothetical protein COT71_04515 [Candidatus Andersenbacteria bacterium CG10_big_fil_rev_8_21_14_0_10_54_11]|uniref:V-type ATP synthase subunit F n=1 Tax=Candidatus Andersenbacteria bacterium CG10_big_fil_rev_8_21_14_0_10_54_11 TaxID=1974485 RepID=A0A2M6WY83_9BACT|nr:MAG: hypothetical protein COT71_04515 [Candidatus Andersenbacteria bacterium CG10_big_fil_rev_8_21_14_0_10_54_11]